MIHPDHLTFLEHGAQRHRSAVTDALDEIHDALSPLPSAKAGVRIHGLDPLREFLAPNGAIGSIANDALGSGTQAVRAILFDKSRDANWSLAWHQDRTICVRRRVNVEGFGPWTVKAGMQHVAPPFDILSRMVTLRVHLDNVDAANAPLLIAPGSHVFGRIPIEDVEQTVRECGVSGCTADPGDVWIYATPILHASEAAERPSRRRVLQVDYSAQTLPGGLQWLGV